MFLHTWKFHRGGLKMKRCTLVLLILIMVIFSFATVEYKGNFVENDVNGNAIYSVEVNEIQIGYKLLGQGDPLLLICGLGMEMSQWDQTFIDILSATNQLILFDNRGMGYTSDNDADYTFEQLVEDIKGLIEILEVNKPNVFGYSMGSVVAQITVLEYPQMVNKVVWHATGISGNDVSLPFASDSADIPVTIQKQMNANLSWSAPLEKYPEIKNDIMLLIGTDDTIVGVDSSLELAALVPGAWLIQIKGCTHSLHREKPVVAAEVVLDFLRYDLSYSK
ncbi:MAG: hypothetical protein PWQ77_1571 [Kosmotogales bacterium]|nr:hypothetical protein [Kosmotogales bacterium]